MVDTFCGRAPNCVRVYEKVWGTTGAWKRIVRIQALFEQGADIKLEGSGLGPSVLEASVRSHVNLLSLPFLQSLVK